MFSFQSAQEHKNRYRFKILSFFSWYPVKVPLRKRRSSEGMLKWDFLCSSSEIYYFPVLLTRFVSVAKVDCVSQCFTSFTTYRLKGEGRSRIWELFLPLSTWTHADFVAVEQHEYQISLFMLLHAGVRAGERGKQGKSREKTVENISVAQRSVLFSSNLGVVLVVVSQRNCILHF